MSLRGTQQGHNFKFPVTLWLVEHKDKYPNPSGPTEGISLQKKYPCPDCKFCQWCAESRCGMCRPSPKKKDKNK